MRDDEPNNISEMLDKAVKEAMGEEREELEEERRKLMDVAMKGYRPPTDDSWLEPVPTTAHDILTAAGDHMDERAATYDKPEGERSMAATVAAFAATTGIEMTETDGWLFMCTLKMVRSKQGKYRSDNYEDGAAYFALAGESAAKGVR